VDEEIEARGGMTYARLIRDLAERCGLTQRQARKTADAYADLICVAVAIKGRIQIPSLGLFYRKKHAARRINHPQTGKAMKLPAFETLGFKANPGLRKEAA
jgi:DNA-binding protein HU-beta